MNAIQAIQTALGGTKFVLLQYIGDLSDVDLFNRTVPAANHAAWQLGHLIHSEIALVSGQGITPNYPTLPTGFKETYSTKNVGSDGPSGFLSKGDYIGLFSQVRDATIAAVGKLTEADLDKPTQGPLAPVAPTVGALLLLVANHTLMHGGQIAVLRRKLGKPIVI